MTRPLKCESPGIAVPGAIVLIEQNNLIASVVHSLQGVKLPRVARRKTCQISLRFPRPYGLADESHRLTHRV